MPSMEELILLNNPNMVYREIQFHNSLIGQYNQILDNLNQKNLSEKDQTALFQSLKHIGNLVRNNQSKHNIQCEIEQIK